MSSAALTPTSYLVLGCLATMGAATPYELKQAVSAGVGYFWSFPHSQLYSEPARLARAGLLDEQRETAGRRRRLFSITDEGLAELHRWLSDPTAALPEIRDIALLKLFFGAHAGRANLIALAQTQHAAHQQRLAVYEALSDAVTPDPAGATLGLGLAWERAATAFWASIAADPPLPG
jgi:DNA-binding PadR family transcriptional regulator